jgi:hypothetical protein
MKIKMYFSFFLNSNSGLSIQRMRGPPPLLRGGFPPQQQQQMQNQRGRVTLSPVQRQQQQRQLQQQLAIQRQQQQQIQQQQNIMRGTRPPMLGRGGGGGSMALQIAGMKRPLPQGRLIGELPAKQPRLTPAANMALQPGLIIAARMCRLCGLNGPYNFMLKDKPEVVEALR